MATFESSDVKDFQVYVEQSGEHKAILQCLQNILPEEFKRYRKFKNGAGKNSLDVLGVGSGGGELDVQILTLLQSTFPAVSITADIVECSSTLTDKFKALVAKTNLQKIPFVWHLMKSEEFEREVKEKGALKTFDFIHMVHMIYYINDLADSIKFYHNLLKNNGRFMIIVEADKNGWHTLWHNYKKELCSTIKKFYSADDIIACLKSLGLKYEEHTISKAFDISECFNPSSQTGRHLLNNFTAKVFYQSFTPEIRAGMLDLLRNKCSTVKDGKVLFSLNASCIIIYA